MVRTLAFSLVVTLAACAAPQPPVLSATRQAPPRVDDCTLWSTVAARLPAKAKLAEVPQVAYFLERWNAAPPESDVTADRIFVAHRGDRVEVFFVTGECLTSHGSLPADDLGRMFGVES